MTAYPCRSPSPSQQPTSSSSTSTHQHLICTYCEENVTKSGDGFYHPFWINQEILCRQCCESLPMCTFCERRTTSAIPISSLFSPSSSPTPKSSSHSHPSSHGLPSSSHRSSSPLLDQPPSSCPAIIHLCQPCASLDRVRSADLSHMLVSVMDFLTALTCVPFQSVLVSARVRLRLAGIHEISVISARRTLIDDDVELHIGGPPATTFGVCVCNINECGNSQQGLASRAASQPSSQSSNNAAVDGQAALSSSPKLSIDILLLRGLSLWLAGAFLAHELIHAVLHCLHPQHSHHAVKSLQSSCPLLANNSLLPCDALLFEEGLCHLAAAAWLTMLLDRDRCGGFDLSNTVSHSKRQMEFWLKKLSYGEHPEFSVGFKFAKQTVESIGWIAAFEVLLRGKELNRGRAKRGQNNAQR